MNGISIVRGRTGNFELVEELGRGSFGVVHLVRNELGACYALKLFGPNLSSEERKSFEQEVAAAQAVDDEHIVRTIDQGSGKYESGKQYLFIVAEYCPDGDYRRQLKRYLTNPHTIEPIIEDFRQILSGLRALHVRKLVHRDMKPENVLVHGSVLKISDLGISRFVDQATRTMTFTGRGTALYAAPEVWTGDQVTPATDLYSVGVMLFEALAGQPPFEAEPVSKLSDMHLFELAPHLKEIAPSMPERLDQIVGRLLAKTPSDRYQTAEQVLEALGKAEAPSVSADIDRIAAKIKRDREESKAQELSVKRKRIKQQRDLEAVRFMEERLIREFDEIVAEVNSQFEEPIIWSSTNTPNGKHYRYGPQSFVISFFSPNAMFENPLAPERLAVLQGHNVVHGGFIQIGKAHHLLPNKTMMDGDGVFSEVSGDFPRETPRDGINFAYRWFDAFKDAWNLILVRLPDELYGSWMLVDMEVPFKASGSPSLSLGPAEASSGRFSRAQADTSDFLSGTRVATQLVCWRTIWHHSGVMTLTASRASRVVFGTTRRLRRWARPNSATG
jgi:serine/threonine protein kinase